MIETLRNFMLTQDGKLLYLLAVLAILMGLDFISGTVAAIINKNIDFKSKVGIYGILRKIISLISMISLIPLAIIIPGDVGIMLVYTLYIGYLVMEFKSVIENLDKMGVDVGPFKIFLNNFEQYVNNKKNQ